MQTPARSMLRTRDIGLIHLKSQALVNLFFGIPMIVLVLPFWGLPLIATVKVTSIYLLIYAIYFVPMWLALPHFLLKPVSRTIDQIEKGRLPDDLKLKRTIEFLLNYPFHSSIRQFFLIVSGFSIGALFIPFGAVSELMPIKFLAIIYLMVIALVVSLIESFLNFTFLENYLGRTISSIVTLRPTLAIEPFDSRRISLLQKMLFVILGTVVAAQMIIFIFIIGKLVIELPSAVNSTIIYLGAFMVLTVGYVILAATLFSRNISTPLHQLIAWSTNVSKGKRLPLPLVTNDEINEVALYSNQMVANMGNLTSWLEKERNQLATEKNKLAVVLSKVADGVVAVDAQHKIIIFNAAMEELTGFSQAKAIGQPVSTVVALYRESGRVYALTEALSAKSNNTNPRALKQVPLRMVAKDQRNKYITLSSASIAEDGSPTQGSILTFHDVTEEKELERMKLDFVSMAAHELRTPLTSIKGYLYILNKELVGKLTKEEATFLNRTLIGTNQLSALIENLLNVSRIERGALKIEPGACSFNRLAQQAVDNLRDQAEHNNIAMEFNPKPESRLVQADQFRVAEVITNLVANAIAYSPAKSKITVEVDFSDAKQAVLRVIDQGVGIPDEAIPHLFTKFYRVAGELSQGSKGTGLGLYISKEIVQAHHGKIWVESAEGHGSTFSFSLPYAPIGATEVSRTKPAPMLQKVVGGGSTNQITPMKK